jgi:hypothetical protein
MIVGDLPGPTTMFENNSQFDWPFLGIFYPELHLGEGNDPARSESSG